eukprot:TRINITY_DN65_c0_g1_i1.p1 TRINITY_DN65_c0_g1~~TRINITY_DN65_c0_g1_i1.p1  ORF type:complete len:491 (+),score=31.01 TRINITY_DN65_c0_g1_i1:132-1475(+)
MARTKQTARKVSSKKTATSSKASAQKQSANSTPKPTPKADPKPVSKEEPKPVLKAESKPVLQVIPEPAQKVAQKVSSQPEPKQPITEDIPRQQVEATKKPVPKQSDKIVDSNQDPKVIKGRQMGKKKDSESYDLASFFENAAVSNQSKRDTTYEGFNLFSLFKDEYDKKLPIPPLDRKFYLENMFNSNNPFFSSEPQIGLPDSWVFWFQSPTASWGKTTKRLYTVSTQEELRNVLEKMTSPGQLNAKAEVYVFKRGIRPDRLDKRNAAGGCWASFLPIALPNSKDVLNAWWTKVIQMVTSGEIPYYKDIVGIKVAVRNLTPGQEVTGVQKDRMEVWTRSAADQQIQVTIGNSLKGIQNQQGVNLRLTYMRHQDVVDKSKTMNNGRSQGNNNNNKNNYYHQQNRNNYNGARNRRFFRNNVQNNLSPTGDDVTARKRATSIKQRALYRL